VQDPDSSPDDGKDNGDEPVISVPEGMVMPIAAASIGNDYGFYHNTTLNNYYVHTGVDFMAEVGAQVFAVEDGVVESIYKDDLLLGTEIVVAHEDGVKSVYRFVTETEGLKVGDSVKKGDVIATVAEPTGNEYKDGAHLHFEITKQGASVEKGQVIATVAEAGGNEYKDGAHLHFEMKKDGVCVDPAVYLTLEEK
jgi:murein DD-endopeptidase MepM/ murein hydrolase activator NlpD